jgi:hypothetical protein
LPAKSISSYSFSSPVTKKQGSNQRPYSINIFILFAEQAGTATTQISIAIRTVLFALLIIFFSA